MILKKIIINDKEVYEPISKEDALKLDDKSILTFTSEDEEDEFEELLEAMEDSEDDEEPFDKVGGFHIIDKHKKHTKKGNNKIIALLPFMEDEEIHKIVESILKNSEDYKDLPLVAVMPFLSDEDCDALFMKFVVEEKYQDDIELSPLAPFVSEECLSKLVDAYIEGKYSNLELDDLYPFMSSKDVKKLFRFFIQKRKEEKE